MKTQTLIGILFTLLDRQRVSAGELAQKYGCSERSIFRYIDELTCAGIPIDVVRGANGGICISDAFKLPRGLLTREEGLRLSEAIKAMCEQLRDPALLSAAKKFTAVRRPSWFRPNKQSNSAGIERVKSNFQSFLKGEKRYFFRVFIVVSLRINLI